MTERQPTKYSLQDINNAALYEPRIEFIKKQLESLLSVVELEKEGQVVEVDAFRLKKLSDWVVSTSSDPTEIIGYAGTYCNCNCVFCYNKGNPPSFPLGRLKRTAEEEFDEIRTRIDYFHPAAGTGLFTTLGSIYEVLRHPYLIETLRRLREKSSEVFRITTNGEKLTPELIAELAEFKPLYLYLSLNTVSVSRHQELMKDKNPRIPLNALPLVAEMEIPYAIVIVPWPIGSVAEMLDDLTKTVAYADEHQAHIIQINLPGYSKYFSSQKLFDLNEVWTAILSRIKGLRERVACPIVAMPTMYEENLCHKQKNLPYVLGMVNNSPAALCGLKRGDIIKEINELSVSTRPQARSILSIIHDNEVDETHLRVVRAGKVIDLKMNPKRFSYPYTKSSDNHLGVIFSGTGLKLSYLERLKELIDSHGAKKVLFLSSALVRPTFEQCLAQSHLLADCKLEIEVPSNNFFGGNIFMGDLLVVQDFIDFIQDYLKRKAKPDLIVIPSSPFNLGGWGRDLTGRVYLDIERTVKIPVALLDCKTIYD